MIRMTSCIFTNPLRLFSKTYGWVWPSLWSLDPNAVKDAPRPKAEDFKYSEPYLYHMTEDMLNEFPEEMKRVFGISTLGQSDLNRVCWSLPEWWLVEEARDCRQVPAKSLRYGLFGSTKWLSVVRVIISCSSYGTYPSPDRALMVSSQRLQCEETNVYFSGKEKYG